MDNERDSELIVEARGLSRSFRSDGSKIDILRDLDIDIRRKETIAVVGASGIGKSTLLHILGTLDRPDGGRLLFRGENVFRFPAERLARFRNRSIGFVFQFHHLLPEFSALENVMMPILISGQSKSDARTRAETILVRVGLADRLGSRVNRLSGGEQQRVALARALVLPPLILLADEPTGNLDRHNSDQIHELLMELNREIGMTLMVVTHNTELAALMGRRVTLNEGQLEEL